MRTVYERLKEPIKLWCELSGIRPRRSFGLNGLDLKLVDFLSYRNGTFVEAGANDGLAQSNTAFFERYLGWRGLLIEAIPELAQQCRTNRPRALVEQCALVQSSFDEREIEMRYCNLMSFAKGARRSPSEDEEHLKRGLQFLANDDTIRDVKVPAKTLSSVIEKHGLQRIDLLSLDVEGYEGAVLRGLDLDKHAPKFILVEANYPDDIENALDGRYSFLAQLSHHDRLYHLL